MRPSFIIAFAKFNGISWITKSPANLIANIVSPLCLLFIITVLSNGALLPFAVVGGVVALISASTLASTGMSAMFRLEFKIQEMLIATKISMTDYLMGFAFSSLFFCLPGIALYTLFSIIFGYFTIDRFLLTMVVIFLLAIASTAIAILVGSRIKRTIGMWAISGILSAVLTLLPPTFYRYTLLPKIVFDIFAISPVTPAAVILQGAYGLAPVDNWMLPLLVGEVIFYVALARAFGKWRDK